MSEELQAGIVKIEPGGMVTFKRFAGGLGFELEYPVACSEEGRLLIRESFLGSMEHMETIVDQLVGLCDEKTGYADKPAVEQPVKNRRRY